jgi:hypothetical protein
VKGRKGEGRRREEEEGVKGRKGEGMRREKG